MPKKIRKIRSVYRKSKSISIKIIDNDSLSIANEQDPQAHVLVLNFANNQKSGGGYGNKGHTQEEYLLRDTNLGDELDESLYPICESPEDACAILSQNITVKSSGRKISIITCPALVGPRVRDNLEDIDISYFVFDNDRENTENRIRLICATAARLQVEVLVLGAWGCGVFCNPVYELCLLWKKYIQLYEIHKVVFPVPIDHASGNDYLHRMFVKFMNTKSELNNS